MTKIELKNKDIIASTNIIKENKTKPSLKLSLIITPHNYTSTIEIIPYAIAPNV